jgi:two-component system OmpR family sensor kinase
MSRLPIRVRVTLAFAAVMAVVLGAVGLFLYLRLATELDVTIDQGLRARVENATPGQTRLAEDGQILDLGHPASLLTEEELVRAQREPIFVDKDHVRGTDDPVRVLAMPGPGGVVAVATAIDDRNEALRSLATLLAIGGPITLLLASLAGYGAAAGALRPVERMRRRAAAIQPGDARARLPTGPADDEVGRLGTTLNEMLARLEEAYARERAFVADASHELRTPLAILKAELELALREGHSPEELAQALRSAAEETDRLVALAEDLLVIARVEDGRLPVRPAVLDAAQVLARFGLPADAPAGLTLRADPDRLQQALGNLVDNAQRHGGGHVELAAERANGRVELHVRDDGPGFPPGFIDAAFERFTRADPSRGRGGAGLGLAIVDIIARSHGGAAGARNRPTGGADVWISLPCES